MNGPGNDAGAVSVITLNLLYNQHEKRLWMIVIFFLVFHSFLIKIMTKILRTFC